MKNYKKRLPFICIILTLSTSLIYSQMNGDFEEMADPLANWSQIPGGLQAAIGSIDQRYLKSAIPFVRSEKIEVMTGWKGEKVSAQFVLWTNEKVDGVTCRISDFQTTSSSLPSSIAQTRFVRYVMTDVFEPGCGYRKPEDFPASLSPDILDHVSSFDIPENTVRPVWLTVDIPHTATPGVYKSKLSVMVKGSIVHEFELELNVQNHELPPPAEWAYHLDLWQHPAAVARVQNLKVWSDEHFEALKPAMKMLANAGQKVITATLNKDPWNQQTYDLYEDMIVWTKQKNGKWSYDYTIFDRWVELMMNLGVKKMINCYSMIPWNNELHYKDARTGKFVDVKADPGTPAFEEMWTPFLKDFIQHLKAKGWLEITNIAMDERSPETMTLMMDFFGKVAPELGISLADNHKSYKMYPHIKDISVKVDAKVDQSDMDYRKKNGLVTTYYVCCSDKFPNVFTFSDPSEAVYSAWYATAAGYDGYLRWAFNSWVENPLTDSRFRTWPGGDTYIIYPDLRSSIRFERLIEGIQDVEKIRILRKEFSAQGTEEAMKKLNKLNSEIEKFNTPTPIGSPREMLRKAKAIIAELSK